MSAPRASEMRSPLIASSDINACSRSGAEPGGDQQRTDFVAVQADRVRLVIQPWPANVRGRGVLKQVFFDGVTIEAGDGAQPAGNGRPGPSFGLHVAAEAFDIRPPRGEQVQAMLAAPQHVLAQIQGVCIPGEAAVPKPASAARSSAMNSG